MKNEWPKAKFYVTEDSIHKALLVLLCLALSIFWWRAEKRYSDLVTMSSNIEDQYFEDVCMLKARVDTISAAIGMNPTKLE